MRRNHLLSSAVIIFVMLFPSVARVGSDTLPRERRVEIVNEGSSLLDAGNNEKAASYLKTHVHQYPGSIEAAGLLIEAYSRECKFDSALAFLETVSLSLSGGEREIFALFIEGAKKQERRNYHEAAADYRESASLSIGVRDTLSAVFCLLSSARCLLGAREGREAVRAVEEMEQLLSGRRDIERLLVEMQVIRGEAYNLMDQLAMADSLYREALDRASAERYNRIKSSCLMELGKLEEKRQRIAEAITFYSSALAEERGLGRQEKLAAVLNNLGHVEANMKNLEKAREHLEEARMLALSCNSDWILGYVYHNLGAVAEAGGNREEALNLFTESLQKHIRQGNVWGELGARLRIGYNFTNLGEYSKAIEHYARCIAAYEEMGSLYGLSWALSGLALANHRLGEFQEAETYYRRTLEVRQELGDRKGAAWCLNSLGMVYDLQGRYREALAHEHEAMQIYHELGDRAGVGTAAFSIGSVYFYLGDYVKSLEHYERAFSIATEIGDDELLQTVISGMGSVYSAAGRLDLAEDFYIKCLGFARESGDHATLIWSLNNLASHYIQIGNSNGAEKYLREALLLIPAQGQDYLRSRVLYLLGKAAASTDDAIGYIEEALSLAAENRLQELEWKCLTDLGELYRLKGIPTESKALQQRAILAVESLWQSVGSHELRRHMFRPAILPYERMVSLILDTSEGTDAVAQAFTYTERSRAQILAVLLREAVMRIGEEDESGLIERERDVTSKLTFLQACLQDGSITQKKRSELLREIEGIERDFMRLRVQMTEREEGYAAAVYPARKNATELISTLRPSERVLSYFLGRDRSYLFSGKDGELTVFMLPPRQEIEEKVGYFLSLLQQYSGEQAGEDTDEVRDVIGFTLPVEVIRRAEEELFDLLLGPVADELEARETLVIIPDGLLNRLPFSLLRNEGEILVTQYEIFYAPSLQSLSYLRERARIRRQAKQRKEFSVVAFGSSGGTLSSSGEMRRVYPFTEIPVVPLSYASEEARAVAGFFKHALMLTEGKASERSFKESPLDRTDIIHIAAHSYVDNEDARRSFIVLNPERSFEDSLAAPSEDGLMQWHEIAGLRLDASLVTLSACKSAGGVLTYGEGITGLTQAFLYAGGSCVLASQMDVPDRYAHRFMLEFYKHITEGHSAVAALRAAQLEAMGWNSSQSSQVHWASFVLIGDGSVTVAEVSPESTTR